MKFIEELQYLTIFEVIFPSSMTTFAWDQFFAHSLFHCNIAAH
jgi:hypothetical protein